MLQGKPITAYYPVNLVERWRPDPIDCTTVACGDERVSPSVPISEGESALGKFVKNGITREREKKGPETLTTNKVFPDGAVTR